MTSDNSQTNHNSINHDLPIFFKDIERADINTLNEMWKRLRQDSSMEESEIFLKLGKKFLSRGDPLIACDIFSRGVKKNPCNSRLHQQLALSLARSGAIHKANEILSTLFNEGKFDKNDEDFYGILARTHKDLWMAEKDLSHLEKSYELYKKGYDISGGFYTGINVATTAMLLGREDEAKKLAKEIIELCLKKLSELAITSFESDISEKNCKIENEEWYWAVATLGEASLILQDEKKAESWYRMAVKIAGKEYGHLASTRRNAEIILDYRKINKDILESYFSIPRIVIFAGHMMDRKDRENKRFPAEIEHLIYDRIAEELDRSDAVIGYSSAACGSDILFLEALIKQGGEANILLPYKRDEFRKDSVDIIEGEQWGLRYSWLLQKADANNVIEVSQNKLGRESISYQYTNLLLLGYACLRAKQLGAKLTGLAVWDGKPGDGYGGTASAVEQWKKLGLDYIVINPANSLKLKSKDQRNTAATSNESAVNEPSVQQDDFTAHIRALLFADVVKFSSIDEEKYQDYVNHFLGAVADLVNKPRYGIEYKNTWGDGLYFVFPDMEKAGEFALDLRDLMINSKWEEKGLPKSLSIRTALHAGPVMKCNNPVTGREEFIGTHVVQAARMEPITPPFTVYASEAFAALAAAYRVEKFDCDHVGKIPLAKNYGMVRAYVLRRK